MTCHFSPYRIYILVNILDYENIIEFSSISLAIAWTIAKIGPLISLVALGLFLTSLLHAAKAFVQGKLINFHKLQPF